MSREQTVGGLIKRRLPERGLSGAEVGRRLGTSSPTASMLTSGGMQLPLAKVPKAAALLGLDARQLLRMRVEQAKPDDWVAIYHALGLHRAAGLPIRIA